jgi:hypothetical protein
VRRTAGTGVFNVFDVPGVGIQATFPQSINAAGDVTGSYVDANGAYDGFVRLPN